MTAESQSAVESDAPRRPTMWEEFTNLPNMLTMLRILLIPPVIWLMLQSTPETNMIAAVLFGVAAFTDWLDGYLARKRNLVSVLGKLLDPLADKLIVMATLIIAAQLGRIPGWFVVLLLSRELAISGLRSVASQEGLMIEVVSAGKYKTALQLVGLVGVILSRSPLEIGTPGAVGDLYLIDFWVAEALVDFGALGFAVLALSLAFSLVSAIIYFRRFIRAAAESRR